MEAVSRHRKEDKHLGDSSLRFQRAKAVREFRVIAVNLLKDFFLITVGIASAAFGLESFLVPNNFIDGGVTGISLLVTELSGWPLPVLILVNIPFIILAYSSLGLEFTIKTAIAIMGLAATVAFAHFPEVTHDNLLVAVFGGFFLSGMALLYVEEQLSTALKCLPFL